MVLHHYEKEKTMTSIKQLLDYFLPPAGDQLTTLPRLVTPREAAIAFAREQVALAQRKPGMSGWNALRHARDKLCEKNLLDETLYAADFTTGPLVSYEQPPPAYHPGQTFGASYILKGAGAVIGVPETDLRELEALQYDAMPATVNFGEDYNRALQNKAASVRSLTLAEAPAKPSTMQPSLN
jgi:hypothetical protein